MTVDIRRYQEAYEKIISQLKVNSQIAAILVYGSIISGDIWEKSDLDFIVITRESGKSENIHTKVFNIPIHINYLSKDSFIDSYKSLLKGGSFHKAFFTGKLAFSNDRDIDDLYLSIRFYGDEDRNIRNIEILANLLNTRHYTNKYLMTGKLETSYQWCVELLTNYSRLLLNIEGHITDKDILSYAVSMMEQVKVVFGVLTGNDALEKRIEYVIDVIDSFLKENLQRVSLPLIDSLRGNEYPLSVDEIKNGSFKQVNGDISYILEELVLQGYITETTRKYLSSSGEYLIDEIVYGAKE